MARTTSTLGKRSRDSVSDEDAVLDLSPRKTRSGRRTGFVIAADETENPFLRRKSRTASRHGGSTEFEDTELGIENLPAPKKACLSEPKGRRPSWLSSGKRHVDAENVVEQAGDAKPRTPSNQRRRDAFAKVPITPRHLSGVIARPGTPQTPRTPSTPHAGPSIYNVARMAFACGTNPNRLIGRDKERAELVNFLKSRLANATSGCIYVSGPPGTGKSALINEVCEDLLDELKFPRSYINCMSIKTARDLAAKLLEDFDGMDTLEGAETETLDKLFHQKDAPHLIVLDEIDHLLDVDVGLLYQVFEWSMDASSNLVVVGIANALDFTDRFLPRLKSRGLRPQLLPFMPYSVAQIASVLTTKLKSLLPKTTTSQPDFVPFLHPTAIQFASKKVAAQTGDLRKAFAISSRAIDLVEAETRSKLGQSAAQITPSPTPSPVKMPLMESMHLSSPSAKRSPAKPQRPQNPMALLTVETAPRATIAHMARVTAAMFSNGSNQRLAALNLQQKAILCSLFVLEERLRFGRASEVTATPTRSSSAPTIKSLHAAYMSLCNNDNIIHALTSTEFRDVLAGLEALSLISWVDGRKGTFSNVAPGTPSRRSRSGGFGGQVVEEKRVASSIVLKELKDSLKGPASDILLSLLAGEGL